MKTCDQLLGRNLLASFDFQHFGLVSKVRRLSLKLGPLGNTGRQLGKPIVFFRQLDLGFNESLKFLGTHIATILK